MALERVQSRIYLTNDRLTESLKHVPSITATEERASFEELFIKEVKALHEAVRGLTPDDSEKLYIPRLSLSAMNNCSIAHRRGVPLAMDTISAHDTAATLHPWYTEEAVTPPPMDVDDMENQWWSKFSDPFALPPRGGSTNANDRKRSSTMSSTSPPRPIKRECFIPASKTSSPHPRYMEARGADICKRCIDLGEVCRYRESKHHDGKFNASCEGCSFLKKGCRKVNVTRPSLRGKNRYTRAGASRVARKSAVNRQSDREIDSEDDGAASVGTRPAQGPMASYRTLKTYGFVVNSSSSSPAQRSPTPDPNDVLISATTPIDLTTPMNSRSSNTADTGKDPEESLYADVDPIKAIPPKYTDTGNTSVQSQMQVTVPPSENNISLTREIADALTSVLAPIIEALSQEVHDTILAKLSK